MLLLYHTVASYYHLTTSFLGNMVILTVYCINTKDLVDRLVFTSHFYPSCFRDMMGKMQGSCEAAIKLLEIAVRLLVKKKGKLNQRIFNTRNREIRMKQTVNQTGV